MKIPADISIIELLRQRESEFVKLWACEEGIRRLLGMVDYPFPAPPPLPSLRKSRSRKASRQLPGAAESSAKAAAAAATSKPPLRLRALQAPNENAYRIVFRRGNVIDSSFQNDPELIRILYGIELETFALLSIETVSFSSLSHWRVVAELWQDAESAPKDGQQA
jgi:hypothetical protein